MKKLLFFLFSFSFFGACQPQNVVAGAEALFPMVISLGMNLFPPSQEEEEEEEEKLPIEEFIVDNVDNVDNVNIVGGLLTGTESAVYWGTANTVNEEKIAIFFLYTPTACRCITEKFSSKEYKRFLEMNKKGKKIFLNKIFSSQFNWSE